MNINLIVGWFAVAIGSIHLLGYLMLLAGKPVGWFGKLEPMREKWGQKAGTALHFTAYVLVPLVGGVIFLTSEQALFN